jgi:hypothetical protein
MKFSPLLKTFDDFLGAFVEVHCTEFYMEKYPQYHKQNEHIYADVDAFYIAHFLNEGIDPQESLAKFLKALSKCSRYGRNENNAHYVKMFIHKGANIKPLTKYLFKIYDPYKLEDFNGRVQMRMRVVDSFWKDLDHDYINSLTDWSVIKPKYWEYLVYDYDSDDRDGDKDEDENKKNAEDKQDEALWFFSYMKYCSQMLNGGKPFIYEYPEMKDFYDSNINADANAPDAMVPSAEQCFEEYEEHINITNIEDTCNCSVCHDYGNSRDNDSNSIDISHYYNCDCCYNC